MSSEVSGELKLAELERDDAAGGLRLSRLAGWNQTLGDWEMMLACGRGFGFSTEAGELVASALALPLGERVSWICMVLVDPEWRRRGLASTLMEACLKVSDDGGRISMLDATEAGEKVYVKLGFQSINHFLRLRLEAGCGRDGNGGDAPAIEPLESGFMDAIAAWDRQRTGLERGYILRHQQAAWPEAAWVSRNHAGEVSGYTLGRRGLNALEIGPLVASDEGTAEALFTKALAAAGDEAIYLDAAADKEGFLERRRGEGWVVERGFARMIRGSAGVAAGTGPGVYASAGPDWS